ncbi:hypothetical protein HK102_006741, partial [Quaeritorhiza haematococci]
MKLTPRVLMNGIIGCQVALCAALVAVFSIESALVAAGITGAFSCLLFLTVGLGLWKKNQMLLMAYMFIGLTWIILGLYHLMIILNVTRITSVSLLSNRRDLIGASLDRYYYRLEVEKMDPTADVDGDIQKLILNSRKFFRRQGEGEAPPVEAPPAEAPPAEAPPAEAPPAEAPPAEGGAAPPADAGAPPAAAPAAD